MASVKVILRKQKQNKQGECPLYLRISKDRQSRFVSMGYYIKESDWNEKDKLVRKSHPNSVRLNNYLRNELAKASDKVLELENQYKDLFLTYVNRAANNCRNNMLQQYSDSVITSKQRHVHWIALHEN